MKALDVLNPNPRSTLSGRLIFQRIFRSKNVTFPSNKTSQNWIEIKFQRNIWGQLDVRTRMRASKSWNFDLEKPIKPIKMDSCVNFADHCIIHDSSLHIFFQIDDSSNGSSGAR